MKSVATRRGFTLVELLTVIAIIAILTVILLPAVGAARRTAQLHSCQNNVKQLTTAIINFETEWNRYPGYNEQLKGGGQIFPWPIALMPNLDRSDIYDRVRQWALKSANQDLPADILAYESVFVCPVDTGLAAYKTQQFSKQDGPGISYVVNAGRADREFRPDGVFFNYPAAKLVCSQENLRDGASKTLLLTENLSATSWAALSGKQSPLTPQSIFVWHNKIPSTQAEIVYRINGGVSAAAPPLTLETARPSSFHPAGVVAGFADGHVALLTNDTPYPVYAQLMTSDSAAQKNTIPDLANYVLRDNDF